MFLDRFITGEGLVLLVAAQGSVVTGIQYLENSRVGPQGAEESLLFLTVSELITFMMESAGLAMDPPLLAQIFVEGC